MTTISDEVAGQIATIIGATLLEVARKIEREVAEATTADEVLMALCPRYEPWLTRLIDSEVMATARAMRPDLFAEKGARA